jgi:hypothetical protein
MSDTNADVARRRRIAMRNRKRSSNSDAECEPETNRRRMLEDHELLPTEEVVDAISSLPKPHITGIKKQSRYDPGVCMTREELKSWRKEARRVRNRESAAASRKKNRERVSELETEVDGLKAKYTAALKMIIDLEASRTVKDRASFTPPVLLRQDLMDLRGSSRPSSPSVPYVQTVSPPQSPSVSPSMFSQQDLLFGTKHQEYQPSFHEGNQVDDEPHHHQLCHESQHQHLPMISRPIACV